jgi:hypothetical protein
MIELGFAFVGAFIGYLIGATVESAKATRRLLALEQTIMGEHINGESQEPGPARENSKAGYMETR